MRSPSAVSRKRLREIGVDRFVVRTLVGQGRVVVLGTQAVHVRSVGWHETRSPVVAAVFEAGENAWADGVSALILAGLTGWEPRGIDIGHPTRTSARHAVV